MGRGDGTGAKPLRVRSEASATATVRTGRASALTSSLLVLDLGPAADEGRKAALLPGTPAGPFRAVLCWGAEPCTGEVADGICLTCVSIECAHAQADLAALADGEIALERERCERNTWRSISPWALVLLEASRTALLVAIRGRDGRLEVTTAFAVAQNGTRSQMQTFGGDGLCECGSAACALPRYLALERPLEPIAPPQEGTVTSAAGGAALLRRELPAVRHDGASCTQGVVDRAYRSFDICTFTRHVEGVEAGGGHFIGDDDPCPLCGDRPCAHDRALEAVERGV